MIKILCFIVSLIITTQVQAKGNFKTDIPVNIEAENSVIAKNKGILDAQKQAFFKAASELTSIENVEKLKDLSNNEILHFINSVSVKEEKAGGNKYIALLNIEINSDLLKDYLIENEMIKVEQNDILIIPIYKDTLSSSYLLWEKENIWRNAWLSKGLIKFGNINLRTISNMYQDFNLIDANTSMNMNENTFQQLSNIAKSNNIYVLLAEKDINNDAKITLKDIKNDNEFSFSVHNNEDDSLMDNTIEKTVLYISNKEKENYNNQQVSPIGKIDAVYTYLNMKDWLMKNKAIEEIPFVKSVDITAIGGGKVAFSINFDGNIENLWANLLELGLSHEQIDNYYIIR